MSRERRLIETFVFLADTLVADFDAHELLHTLAERCVELLDVDAAGVMLATQDEALRAVAASGRAMKQLEIFEVAAAEGPSYDALKSGRAIVRQDLTQTGTHWPSFTPRALALGFCAGYGFPLQLRGETVGALDLFQTRARCPLDDDDLRVAQGFADVAAIGLMQEGLLRDADARVRQLTHALDSRVVVEQAKGALAERLSLDPVEAFERMRRHARDRNRKLRDVARDVLDGRLDP